MKASNENLSQIGKKFSTATNEVVGQDWVGKDAEAMAKQIEEISKMIGLDVPAKLNEWMDAFQKAVGMLEERQTNTAQAAANIGE